MKLQNLEKKVLFITFICFLFVFETSLSEETCSLNGWSKYEVEIDNSETAIFHAYQRWPRYVPEHRLYPQIVVLNGGTGKVDCGKEDMYSKIGKKASYYWRQAMVLDLGYWENGRNSVKKVADYVVNLLDQLVELGYLRESFYLMGGSAGTAVMSAMLEYHPQFVSRVERAIFVSGPFTGISKYYIQNNTIRNLMDKRRIDSIDSLNNGITYDPTRLNQWIIPIIDRRGLRFFVAEDDDIFCLDNTDSSFLYMECELGTMLGEFDNWLDNVTDGAVNSASLEEMGMLWVYPQGGHDLFSTHPELLDSALRP